MKAAVINSTGGPAAIEIVQTDVPTPKDGQVRAGNRTSGMQGNQIQGRVVQQSLCAGAGEGGEQLRQSSGGPQ